MGFGERGDVLIDIHNSDTPTVSITGELALILASHIGELPRCEQPFCEGADVQDTNEKFDRYSGQLIARLAAVSVFAEEIEAEQLVTKEESPVKNYAEVA